MERREKDKRKEVVMTDIEGLVVSLGIWNLFS